MSNLEIWDFKLRDGLKVSETNKDYTKKDHQGFDSINGEYRIRNATEVFGSYGNGFGLKEHIYNIIDVGEEKLLALDAVFFYKWKDKEYSFPASSSTYLLRKTKRGLVADEDAWKKVETDILGKALSKLGFHADVYLNEFSDDKYQSALNKTVKRTIVEANFKQFLGMSLDVIEKREDEFAFTEDQKMRLMKRKDALAKSKKAISQAKG